MYIYIYLYILNKQNNHKIQNTDWIKGEKKKKKKQIIDTFFQILINSKIVQFDYGTLGVPSTIQSEY